MSERSVLLPPHDGDHDDGGGGGSRQNYATLPPPPGPAPASVTRKRRTRGATPTTILITLTSLLLPFLLLSALLINSFVPSSDEEIAYITDSALIYDPQDVQLSILNFTSGYTGVWVEVNGKAGVDMDAILGVNRPGVKKDGRGHGARWWEALRTWVGRKGVQMIGPLVVMVPEPITVFPQETSSSIKGHNVMTLGNEKKSRKPLVTLSIPTPVDLPLIAPGPTTQLPSHAYHLHFTIPHPATLLAYTHSAWLEGAAQITVHIPHVIIVPRETQGWFIRWRKWIRIEQRNVRVPQKVDLPDMPGIPGPNDDLADFIRLDSYGFHTAAVPTNDADETYISTKGDLPSSIHDRNYRQQRTRATSRIDDEEERDTGEERKQLRVSAIASARNPFFNTTLANVLRRPIAIPLEFGFGIYLSADKESAAVLHVENSSVADAQTWSGDGYKTRQGKKQVTGSGKRLVKMAEVVTMPFSLHGQERVRIHVEGIVKTGQHHADDGDEDDDNNDDDGTALSTFLNNYLQGRPNNVTILGLPIFPLDASPDVRVNMTKSNNGSSVVPPTWMQRLVSETVHAVVPFPAPPNRTNLIRSVTIEQMKISERAGKMRASGVVVVLASLPPDLANIEVAVQGVLPDVLISDGKFEGDGDGDEVDPGTPPYPARAFGRIHPPDYLPAISSPSPDDPTLLIVRAPLHDVPLDILPGRDKVLSDFVTKIVFKGSAEAGIVGNAAVRVDVVGVGKEVEVRKLPVSGVVNVGRPRVV